MAQPLHAEGVKMAREYIYRGHAITFKNGAWVYDTGELVSNDPGRPCGHCGRPVTPEGHDGCLGTLPGVNNACCGHGDPAQAYVQYTDGRRVGGDVVHFEIDKR